MAHRSRSNSQSSKLFLPVSTPQGHRAPANVIYALGEAPVELDDSCSFMSRAGSVSRRRKNQTHHIHQFQNLEVPKAGPSKKELIQDALNQPSTALIPATSYDEYSVMGSPSRLNRRSLGSRPQLPGSTGQSATSAPQRKHSFSRLPQGPPRTTESLVASASNASSEFAPTIETTRRAQTPGGGVRRASSAYKLDPCAALDLASSSPVGSREGRMRLGGSASSMNRRAFSLSSTDLQNLDLAVETDPAHMQAEIRRLRNALVELYRGPNRVVGGSQFRTLVRDTDAPSTCLECEGLKGFIKHMQREHSTLKYKNADLKAKVEHCQPYIDMAAQTQAEMAELREAAETLRGQLRLREEEVEVLRRELRDRPTVSDSSTPQAHTPQLLVDQTQEVNDLTAKLAEARGVHDVELSHYMSVNEALQAQLASLHAERDGLARLAAEMSGLEVGDVGSLTDALRHIRDDLARRRTQAARAEEGRAEARKECESGVAKARAELASLAAAKQVLQQDFDKVVREREALADTLKRETDSVRRGVESMVNTSAVRVCVVAPTVNVHLSPHKSVVYKSSVAKEKIREFVEHKVLPRFVSLFVQTQDDPPTPRRPLDKTTEAPDDGQAKAAGAGGLDTWIEAMLMEIQTVVEGNISRIFHDE